MWDDKFKLNHPLPPPPPTHTHNHQPPHPQTQAPHTSILPPLYTHAHPSTPIN